MALHPESAQLADDLSPDLSDTPISVEISLALLEGNPEEGCLFKVRCMLLSATK
jgi:hypothetical protein